MSYPEKRSIVSILVGVALLVAYGLFAFEKVRAGDAASDDLKFWSGAMLIFIVIGIVASVIIQIVFHILLSISIAVRKQVQTGTCDDKSIEKEIAAEMVEDEMDKLVELKSLRAGYVVAGIGLVVALFFAYLSFPISVVMNILFLSFCGGSILEGVCRIFFYRRGITHG